MASEGTGPMELGGSGVPGWREGSPGGSPGLPRRTAGSDTPCAHLRGTFRTPPVGGWGLEEAQDCSGRRVPE